MLFVGAAGSGLGLQRTNTCSGCAAGSLSGHLVFDQDLVPGAGSGLLNVPLTPAPPIAASDIFSLALGALPLDFAFDDAGIAGGPAAQYGKGIFNGLFFVDDFYVGGTPYQLSVQGGIWTIYASDLQAAASSYINIGRPTCATRPSHRSRQRACRDPRNCRWSGSVR